jgi:predicted MFS family arabinose efflux permease
MRGFADGAVSLLLVSYLTALGFNAFQVGAIVTGTLLGSAALTLFVGLMGSRWGRRKLLLGSCALMVATGLAFAGFTRFWPLMIVAVVGTLNPSSGDVSVFLPVEQAVLSDTVGSADRTAIFAWYNLSGTIAGSLGALASSLPLIVARNFGWGLVTAERSGFVTYSLIALIAALIYARLSPAIERHRATTRIAPLAQSRKIVVQLAALFSLDSFGGGFVVQSLVALWLYRRFGLSAESAGAIFFAAGLLSGFSQLASAFLAARIGLINTMVFTHLPANGFLILAGFMPNAKLAVACLLARMLLSQMDVPARQSYVMAVVTPEERPAAASVTNVPRSLAAALAPLITGAMLSYSDFGWPLICGGVLKAIYDLLLLKQFRAVQPHQE